DWEFHHREVALQSPLDSPTYALMRSTVEQEVCSATAAPDGTWSCVPGVALPAGPGLLQATATLNGVSATSEQIAITVAG
ncbi:hypothetical protein ACWEGM_09490, partial [Streptomyces nigra]